MLGREGNKVRLKEEGQPTHDEAHDGTNGCKGDLKVNTARANGDACYGAHGATRRCDAIRRVKQQSKKECLDIRTSAHHGTHLDCKSCIS